MSLDSNSPRSLDSGRGLLRAGGYNDGDVIVLGNYGSYSRTATFTTTTYDLTFGTHFEVSADWSEQFPASATPVVQLICRFEPGTGETPSARMRNTTDGENLGVEVTGTAGTNTSEKSGWVEYTPTTTSGVINILIQLKTDIGSNSSDVVNAELYYGVKI